MKIQLVEKNGAWMVAHTAFGPCEVQFHKHIWRL